MLRADEISRSSRGIAMDGPDFPSGDDEITLTHGT